MYVLSTIFLNYLSLKTCVYPHLYYTDINILEYVPQSAFVHYLWKTWGLILHFGPNNCIRDRVKYFVVLVFEITAFDNE